MDNFPIEEVNNLRWYPWIGKEYYDGFIGKKLLLVGESHYAQGNDENEDKEYYDDFMRDKYSTTDTIKSLLGKNGNWNLYTNTYKALLGDSQVDIDKFWSKVSFYNFIQRPMLTNKDRPTKEDSINAWNTFLCLIKILKPTDCIFLGSENSKYFTPVIEKLDGYKNKYSINQWKQKIGRYNGKVATIEYDDFKTEIVFIKHPSKFFIWKKWHSFLMSESCSSFLKFFKEFAIIDKNEP